MSEESTGVGQRTKSLVAQAKRKVGVGDPPLVTEAGGRAEGMAEAFTAFGEGDMDRFLSVFSDDVEWSAPKGENFPGAGSHDGREAVREAFVADAKRSYASFGFHPDRYLETPGENLVVALGAFKGEGLKGDGALDVPAVQVWEFDGDKAVFVGIYTDSAAFPGVVTEQEEKEREEEDDEDDAA
jgi:ketosteroid isomerase-like protein